MPTGSPRPSASMPHKQDWQLILEPDPAGPRAREAPETDGCWGRAVLSRPQGWASWAAGIVLTATKGPCTRAGLMPRPGSRLDTEAQVKQWPQSSQTSQNQEAGPEGGDLGILSCPGLGAAGGGAGWWGVKPEPGSQPHRLQHHGQQCPYLPPHPPSSPALRGQRPGWVSHPPGPSSHHTGPCGSSEPLTDAAVSVAQKQDGSRQRKRPPSRSPLGGPGRWAPGRAGSQKPPEDTGETRAEGS